MGIRVALHHATRYRYDRPVALSPHEVRLRPAPHTRTPIRSYALSVLPASHFIHWQQDPYGNWLARFVFSEKTTELTFSVALEAELAAINPFDFFIEPYAERFPFAYAAQLWDDLVAYTRGEPAAPLLADWIARVRGELAGGTVGTTQFLVALNQRLARDVTYEVRMEPGVQTPARTLELARGSCRDSAWLLVQILRHLGLGARFVSGYLIQLSADGPEGPADSRVMDRTEDRTEDRAEDRAEDRTDLHAWAEVYVPGAGWIGLDPTSGLLAGEGHIPLACAASPPSAAPITGQSEPTGVEFDYEMRVTRLSPTLQSGLPAAAGRT